MSIPVGCPFSYVILRILTDTRQPLSIPYNMKSTWILLLCCCRKFTMMQVCCRKVTMLQVCGRKVTLKCKMLQVCCRNFYVAARLLQKLYDAASLLRIIHNHTVGQLHLDKVKKGTIQNVTGSVLKSSILFGQDCINYS